MEAPKAKRRFRRLYLVAFLLLLVLVALPLGAATLLIVTNPRGIQESEGWVRLAEMGRPRGEVAMAYAAGSVYVLGGLEGGGAASGAVDSLALTAEAPAGSLGSDAHLPTWRAEPDLPEPRHHASAAAIGNLVYLTGGGASATDWTPRANFWVFDTAAQKWSILPDMPAGRLGHAMVALEGRLWVVGGVGGSATYVFDPSSGQWEVRADIPTPRDHLGAAVLGEKIAAVGGRDRSVLGLMELYDPVSDKWERGPSMPVPTSGAAVGSDGRVLVVMGGEVPDPRSGEVRNVTQVYRSHQWTLASPPLVAIHGVQGASTPQGMVSAAGSRRQGIYSPLAWTGATQLYFWPG